MLASLAIVSALRPCCCQACKVPKTRHSATKRHTLQPCNSRKRAACDGSSCALVRTALTSDNLVAHVDRPASSPAADEFCWRRARARLPPMLTEPGAGIGAVAGGQEVSGGVFESSDEGWSRASAGRPPAVPGRTEIGDPLQANQYSHPLIQMRGP